MKKILLATLFLVNIEAQELSAYLDECSPMDDMRCVDMRELSSQAMSLFQQQKFPQAIEKFKSVMTMAKKEKLEPSHFYNNLGLAYENNKEYDNALKYFNKNVEYELGKGEKRDKVILSIVYGNIGLAYMGKKEFTKAIEVAKKSLDIVYKLKDNPKIAERERKIGILYKANGEYDKAIEHYEKAFKFNVDNLGHSVLVDDYIEVAQIWQNKKEYDKAIKYFEKIRKKSIEIVGEEHPQTAMIYAYMGASYIEQKSYKKAKEFSLKALKIYKKTGTPQNPLIEAMLTNLKYIDKHFITINNKAPEGK